ncbi:MAG: hypothetical protein JNL34_04640 [Anaerolineae bacterium]|nr:hypothetical protein [Anaerolineae bacterium]
MRPFRPAFALWIAALCLTAACAPASVTPSAQPTMPPVTAAAQAPPPTRDLHTIPTVTAQPISPPAATPSLAAAPTVTVLNWIAQRDPFLLQVPAAAPEDELIGLSAGNHALVARRFGAGPRLLMLVGGMHGGYEQNTVALAERLAAHFAANPQDIPAGWSVVIVPAANPDGLLRGQNADGRFNAHGVDLNRNWGCGWQPTAVWRATPVSPGAAPFSEPETRALADFITRLQPDAALFYHSKAGGVFAGDCPTGPAPADSEAMAAVYGEASGYSYGQDFSAYPVTGTAATWADGQGIYSADVELETDNLAEFDRNLRAVLAVMAWMEG